MRRGDVDCEVAEKFSVRIEDLDEAVAAVGNVYIVLSIDGDAVRDAELTGLIAGFAPGFEPVAVLVDFGDAGIDVAIADVSIAGGVPGDVGDLAEHAVNGRERRLDVLWRFGALIGSLLFAAEGHNDVTFLTEFDNHVRAFVGDPNVVVPIDLDGVGKGPGGKMMADLAEKFSVGVKFA